jgi:hypothetical protein
VVVAVVVGASVAVAAGAMVTGASVAGEDLEGMVEVAMELLAPGVEVVAVAVVVAGRTTQRTGMTPLSRTQW